MTKVVTLHDDGIKDIRKAVDTLIARYKKITKKDPSKAKLHIVFKRGPITMSNGEWSKLPAGELSLDTNEVLGYFKLSNLNWGVLGYGDTKGGLKELIKFSKTKLNPKQLLGEKQDLKMTINKSYLFKEGDKISGKIIITVPDKALGGTDVQSPILEKQGYLGIEKWKAEALKLLKNTKLDSRLKDILENKAKLGDVVEKFESSEEETKPDDEKDNEVKGDTEKALLKLRYTKSEVNQVMGKLDLSKGTSEAVKQDLSLLKKD
jgi:hypothetical protein